MNDKHYHIDVTPEEEHMFDIKKQITEPKIKEPRTLVITGAIIAAHVVCAACVLGFSSTNAAQKSAEDKNKQEVVQSNIENQGDVPVEAKPTEPSLPQTAALSSHNKIAAPPNLFPKPAQVAPSVPNVETHPPKPAQVAPSVPKVETHPPKPAQNKLVKNYVVKSGDTIYSIAKKYHLVSARLLEINGIKDPKQLKVGQVLKFM